MTIRVSLRALIPAGLLLSCAFVIRTLQPKLMQDYRALGAEESTYAVPQPDHILVFSLGYRSALADLLFGRTMVDVGVHFAEHRVMWNLPGYLQAIVRLEPRYRDVYYYADSMLTLSTVEMPKENFREARNLLEHGLKLFPDDEELWINAGMFMSYLAPGRLPPEEDREDWKRAGAQMIQHACDIWPRGRRLPDTCVSAANLLSRTGQTEAAIANLRRILAVTNDPAAQQRAYAALSQLAGEQEALKEASRKVRMAQIHEEDLPGTSETVYQILGPEPHPTKCWGRHRPADTAECATSFAQYADVLSTSR